MGLRSFAPMVIACPGCGRTTSTYFQELADRIQSWLRAQMPQWRGRYPGVENMHVAVMGCVVNGPGESKHANVGISLPGSGENPVAPVYVDGVKTVTLKGDDIAAEFQKIVEQYVVDTYSNRPTESAKTAGDRHGARLIVCTDGERRPAGRRNKHESRTHDDSKADTGDPRDERRPAGRGAPVGVLRGHGARRGCGPTAIATSARRSSNTPIFRALDRAR